MSIKKRYLQDGAYGADIHIAKVNSVGSCLSLAGNGANSKRAYSSVTCTDDKGGVVAEFSCKSKD